MDALGASLERYGFVTVVGHGIDPALLQRAYRAAEEAFALPEAAKLACERPEIQRQRGYTPFGQERAKDQHAADLKEFWHVGRDLPPGHPSEALMGRNAFPAEVPEFAAATRELFAALEGFAIDLLHTIAAWLGVPVLRFHELIVEGNSVLRVINYPDVGEVPAGAVRAAAHEDINLLTILPAATRPGLELLTHEGEWLPIEAPPGAMICDTGDMMELLTSKRLPATTHRVVNPTRSDGGRMSMPFFLHPHPLAMLGPLDGSRAPRRAHDYLLERLAANNVA